MPCGPAAALTLGLLLHAAAPALADEFQQDQQAVKLHVELAGDMVVIDMHAPLDRLVGFAHRPRTVAHFQAGQALLQMMRTPDLLVRLDESAQCALTGSAVDAPVLSDTPLDVAALSYRTSTEPSTPQLTASFEFKCAQPEQLATLDLALFDVFDRVERIDASVTGPTEESTQQLLRPQRAIRLVAAPPLRHPQRIRALAHQP